ncbi:serine acetyltransferase [Pontibacter sp. HSC-14F20]|uniref:serine O-acetyltransferase EpsC n=1 Tax=Pontibacter sp. HSC-14F20 TaxID=2864136 RepID=UPI001C733812|nr:serine O-acetyltransferase EpsC [Pontibacter sp. HSC-14F20]MBX0332751.1 serine acetyltransferase [Pontibacter sp. HSC-14F20]
MTAINQSFIDHLTTVHQQSRHVVPHSMSCAFLDGLLQLLFPSLSERSFSSRTEVEAYAMLLRSDLEKILFRIEERLPAKPYEIADAYFESLPDLQQQLTDDAAAIEEGDPAAVNIDEVIRTYPGFFAVAVYRLAHKFCRMNVPLLPRVLATYAHTKTGIDIHPGANIGARFCIDHGTGVVIGETADIGDNVKVYQGVTLGALSVEKSMANLKRHPTIEDNVIIYAGATILGGKTVVGHDSIIGGNVWLTESVPPFARVYHHPQIKVSYYEDRANVLNFSI